METPYPKLEGILSLVEDSLDGEVVLPEFQRSFVWGNQDIKDLLISILSGYFIGTFLFLRRAETFDFKTRYIEGVEKVNSTLPQEPNEKHVDRAVLDGQQRLTALFYALHNPQDVKPKGATYAHRYFARAHEKLKGKDWDDDHVIWSVSENDRVRNIEIDLGDGLRKYSFRDILGRAGPYASLLENTRFKIFCYENGIIPFACLKNDERFNSWLDGYVGHFISQGEPYEQVAHRKEKLRKLFTDWLGFQVPGLTLENRPISEVAEIFERINRTGIELSVFALATAVFFKAGINLRDWWKEYYLKEDGEIAKFCKDEDDEEYPKYLIQIMALLQGKEVKKKILINPREISVDRPKWESACKLLDGALRRLQNSQTGYGVIRVGLLPYTPIIVTLAGLLGLCSPEVAFRKLDSWYWSSVFTGRYAGASDTVIKQDYSQVSEWIRDDSKKPEVVSEAENTIDSLNLKNVDRGALYKAVLNLVALEGAKDFFSGQSIELMKLNDHHIFPRKSGIKLTNENCILNRTLISDESNKVILNKKPSEYLDEARGKIGDDYRVKAVLATHLIDEKAFSAMKENSYDAFLAAREDLIKTKMKEKVTL